MKNNVTRLLSKLGLERRTQAAVLAPSTPGPRRAPVAHAAAPRLSLVDQQAGVLRAPALLLDRVRHRHGRDEATL